MAMMVSLWRAQLLPAVQKLCRNTLWSRFEDNTVAAVKFDLLCIFTKSPPNEEFDKNLITIKLKGACKLMNALCQLCKMLSA
jgi:hypothetical protein